MEMTNFYHLVLIDAFPGQPSVGDLRTLGIEARRHGTNLERNRITLASHPDVHLFPPLPGAWSEIDGIHIDIPPDFTCIPPNNGQCCAIDSSVTVGRLIGAHLIQADQIGLKAEQQLKQPAKLYRVWVLDRSNPQWHDNDAFHKSYQELRTQLERFDPQVFSTSNWMSIHDVLDGVLRDLPQVSFHTSKHQVCQATVEPFKPTSKSSITISLPDDKMAEDNRTLLPNKTLSQCMQEKFIYQSPRVMCAKKNLRCPHRNAHREEYHVTDRMPGTLIVHTPNLKYKHSAAATAFDALTIHYYQYGNKDIQSIKYKVIGIVISTTAHFYVKWLGTDLATRQQSYIKYDSANPTLRTPTASWWHGLEKSGIISSIIYRQDKPQDTIVIE